MTHDPLQALLRLRRMTADEARRDVAECLRIESEAAAAVAAIKASIERETEVSDQPCGRRCRGGGVWRLAPADPSNAACGACRGR